MGKSTGEHSAVSISARNAYFEYADQDDNGRHADSEDGEGPEVRSIHERKTTHGL